MTRWSDPKHYCVELGTPPLCHNPPSACEVGWSLNSKESRVSGSGKGFCSLPAENRLISLGTEANGAGGGGGGTVIYVLGPPPWGMGSQQQESLERAGTTSRRCSRSFKAMDTRRHKQRDPTFGRKNRQKSGSGPGFRTWLRTTVGTGDWASRMHELCTALCMSIIRQ